jgi:hypothetical protein
MEHRDDAPLADDGRRGPIPDDQPAGGPAGPEDENMPARPLADDGPQEPAPERESSG